jgi:hypothetical protein
LLLLLYSFYAVMGMQLFGFAPLQDIECQAARSPDSGYTSPEYCDPDRDFIEYADSFGKISGGSPGQMIMGGNRQYTHHSSFRNFGSAIMLLIQVCAGQDWKFVMYAVGGEPGRDGPYSMPYTAFMYFCSLFFFSNYILLNLFIAVILDNFAASMREQELDISEEDFEYFKYAFRLRATDKTPDMMPFTKMYGLILEIAQRQAHNDDGEAMENPMTPPDKVEWDPSADTAWRLSVPQDKSVCDDENAEWIKA